MKILNCLFIPALAVFLFSCADEPFVNADVRTEISKTWTVLENDGIQDYTFESVISKNLTDDTKVDITNFHKMANVKATVFADKTISVPDQKLGTSNIWLKNCTGTISATYQSIAWKYTIDDPQEAKPYAVTATYKPSTLVKKKIRL